MNTLPTAHPSVEVLRAFILGQASFVPAEVVAAHLAICPDCRKVVERLSGDNFADRVKKAQPAAAASSTPDPLAVTRDPPLGAPAVPPIDVPPELARHADYEIQRQLGAGGMGVVYLARNKVMDRLEVLKVVNKGLLDRPGARERFEQEIRSAARLKHPNVVTAYAVLRQGELLGLAMEFVDGVDLARLVQQKGPRPVQFACHYARQVALALQHAYEQGLVHRDIKPHNLMCERNGRVKVLDFGLAKVGREEGTGSGLTGDNVMMGTPDYMAPEQATDARAADIRADLYSLGCTLYFLLTGRPPFVEETPMQVILAHMQKQLEPVTKLRPNLPAGLAAVVARLLAKNPAERYQTPVEVARELLPFAKGEAKPTTQPAPPPLPLASPVARTAVPRDTSAVAPRQKPVSPVVPAPPHKNVPPPKRYAGAKRPPLPKAEVTKRPPGAGRKIGLWAAVVTAAALGGFLAVWLAGGLSVDPGKKSASESEVPVPPLPPVKPLQLAVTKVYRDTKGKEWDNMARMLDGLGEGYRYTELEPADLLNADRLKEFDVVFFTCGFQQPRADQDLAPRLRDFVANGGVLYASDWRRDCIALAFPECRDARLEDEGKDGIVNARVVDPGLRDVLNADTIPLNFNLDRWKTASFSGSRDHKVTVLLEGTYKKQVGGGTATAPLLVKFRHGKGTVIFTSFHNERQNSVIETKLLKYLVFSAVTAKIEAQISQDMIKGGYVPRKTHLLNATDTGNEVKNTYRLEKADRLRFVLGFESRGARMRLTAVSPQGKTYQKEGTSSFAVEVADASAGLWEYTVTILKVPYREFPFTLVLGEKAAGNPPPDGGGGAANGKPPSKGPPPSAEVPPPIAKKAEPPAERIVYKFGPEMQVGLALLDPAGREQAITYDKNPRTSNTVVRVDGKDFVFGSNAGTWNPKQETLGKGAGGRERRGQRSVWICNNIIVTQTIEIVPNNSGGGPDTCLIRYQVENKDAVPHTVGLRNLVDTLMVDNDGHPFALPEGKLITTRADFQGARVPSYVKALQHPNMQAPGLVAHLTLKPGGGLAAPDRFSITHWPDGKVLGWEVPMRNIDGAPDKSPDAAVVIYWHEANLGPNATRNVGYAYGAGVVTCTADGQAVSAAPPPNADIQEKNRLLPGPPGET